DWRGSGCCHTQRWCAYHHRWRRLRGRHQQGEERDGSLKKAGKFLGCQLYDKSKACSGKFVEVVDAVDEKVKSGMAAGANLFRSFVNRETKKKPVAYTTEQQNAVVKKIQSAWRTHPTSTILSAWKNHKGKKL
ncbi:unnamed protein product, partial [Aphanomyces euteiches]